MSTYMIWNLLTNSVVMECMVPEVARDHAGPSRLVIEFPIDMMINFYNVRLLPTAALFEAHQRWITNEHVRNLEHDD